MRSHFLLGTLLAFASHSAFVRGFLVDNTQFYKSLEQNSIGIKGNFTLRNQLTKKYLSFARKSTGHGRDSKMGIVTQSQPAMLGLEWLSSKATSGKQTRYFRGLTISFTKFCVASQYGRSKPDRGGGDVAGVAYTCKKRGDPTIVKAMWPQTIIGERTIPDPLIASALATTTGIGNGRILALVPMAAAMVIVLILILAIVIVVALVLAVALAIALAVTLALAMVIVLSTRIIISFIITVDLKFSMLGVIRMP